MERGRYGRLTLTRVFFSPCTFPDAQAATASAIMQRTRLPILSSELGEFQFTNAICGRVFTKDLDAQDVQRLLDLLSQDIAAGIVHLMPVSNAVFARGKHVA